MSRKPGPLLYCDRSDPTTGEPCKFSTKWGKFNLNRHIAREHKEKKNGFVQYLVDEDGFLQKEMISMSPRAANPAPQEKATAGFSPMPTSTPASPGVAELRNALLGVNDLLSLITSNTSIPQLLGLVPQGPASNSSTDNEISHPHSTVTPRAHTTVPPSLNANTNAITSPDLLHSQILLAAGNDRRSASFEPLPKSEDTISNAKDTSFWNPKDTTAIGNNIPRTRAQQLRDSRRKRLCDSLEKESLPYYKVKRSKTKGVLQQRALDWKTNAGKVDFDNHYASRLARWGLKETHKGTCLWLPADWDALEPSKLIDAFITENCPVPYAAGALVCPSYPMTYYDVSYELNETF
jgi:hypothetical protein